MKKRTLSVLLILAMLFTAAAPGLAAVEWDPTHEVTLTLFADITWLAWDALDGICAQFMKENTGITINMVKATDSNQLSLMISSGELPDLICATTDNNAMYDLSDSDLCYSYNELIEAYCPDWEISPVEQALNSYYSTDGKFYMLMNNFNTIEELEQSPYKARNIDNFYIRGDLYEQLGSPEIHDTETFMEVLEAAKEQFPEVIPMVFQMRNYKAFSHLVGFDTGMPTDTDGNYVYQTSDPKFKEFWAVINECYRRGFITEENFSFTSDDQQLSLMSAGSAFMITNFFSGAKGFTNMVQQSVPDAYYMELPVMDNYKNTKSVTGWQGLFITRNCSDPETAIKLVRWVKQPEIMRAIQSGYEGIDYSYDENGILVMGDRYNESSANGTVATDYTPMHYILSSSSFISECESNYANASEYEREIYAEAWDKTNWSNVLGLCNPSASSDEGVIKISLDELVSEYFGICCLSKTEEEFEANYAKMLEEAEAIGVETLNAYLSETYKTLSEQLGTR